MGSLGEASGGISQSSRMGGRSYAIIGMVSLTISGIDVQVISKRRRQACGRQHPKPEHGPVNSSIR